VPEKASEGQSIPMEQWSVEIPQDPSDWMNQVGQYLDTPRERELPAQPNTPETQPPPRT